MPDPANNPRHDLPDIRDLTESGIADRRAQLRAVFHTLVGVAGLALVAFAAVVTWGWRTSTSIPDWVHGVAAALCVVVPVLVTTRAMRRHGSEMVVPAAIVAPIVVWLLACCFGIIADAL